MIFIKIEPDTFTRDIVVNNALENCGSNKSRETKLSERGDKKEADSLHFPVAYADSNYRLKVENHSLA